MTTANKIRHAIAARIGYQTQGHGFTKVHHSLTLKNAMPDIYTRAEYMKDAQHEIKTDKGTAAHRRYFGQFVTPGTVARVVNAIGRERLIKSTHPHLSDIPLNDWDRLTPQLPGSGGFTRAGDYYTKANGVCLAKEAARQYIESQTATN